MKKLTRTQLRESIFLILFRVDFFREEEIGYQIKDFFFNEDGFSEEEKQYVADKVMAVLSRLSEIDSVLDEISVGWKVKRMTKVDLTALRLAYYEIKYDDSVPVSVAINEAVELAKNYGTDNSGSFVNGILAKVAADADK